MAAQLGVTCCSVYLTAALMFWACANQQKTVWKAREGKNVSLPIEENRHNELVVWIFGVENPNMRIATIKRSEEVKSDYEERFRDRLILDGQTGALTITQLKTSDSGFYQFQCIGDQILTRNFHLIVYSFVSAPSITVAPPVIKTSSSSVTMECSVQNSRELKLSWYRGKERLTETSSPKLPTKLTLAIEVDGGPDGDNYSCVAENPVETRTTKIFRNDSEQGKAENSSWCQNEAAVRLLISAGIAFALILLLVDHVRL